MDIGFSEEQELLRDTARKFLDAQCPTKFVREMMATEAAVTEAFWRQLADKISGGGHRQLRHGQGAGRPVQDGR